MKATKANQQSQGDSTTIVTESRAINFNGAYILKGNTLQLPTVQHSPPPEERKFKSAKELAALIACNNKLLFGQDTFWINSPKKSEFNFWNEFAPTGLLLDISDEVKPRFYVVDVMLSSQSFFEHFLPRVTRFLSSLKNSQAIGGLCELIGKEKEVIKELRLRERSLDCIKNAVSFNHNLLIIMDDGMKEMQEMKETYPEAWQKIKPMMLKKYARNGDIYCVVEPSFAEIHRKEKVNRVRTQRVPNIPLTEEEHLNDSIAPVQEVYDKIKVEVLKENAEIQFNAQRYYIAMRLNKNLAFFKIGKKRINLVVMLPEKDTKAIIKRHLIIPLKDSVQKFYNGSCCSLVIENSEHLNEVIVLLKKLIIK